MKLRTSTVAGLCLMLGVAMWIIPVAAFDVEYDGIPNDRMSWSCQIPVLGLAPGAVDLDAVRAQLDELPDDDTLGSRHPDCRKLAIAQVALGGIAIAAGLWQGRRWWLETADAREEKKFEKLQEFGSGKKKSILS